MGKNALGVAGVKKQDRTALMVLVALALTVYWLGYLAAKRVDVGSLAPSFEAISLSTGLPVSVPDTTLGRLTLLSFWAHSCEFCPQQFADLDSLIHLYGPRGLAVVAVSIDPADPSATDSVAIAASSLDPAIIAVRDTSGHALRRYRLTGTPETLLLDSEGRVLLRGLGIDVLHAEALLGLIEQNLHVAQSKGASQRRPSQHLNTEDTSSAVGERPNKR